MSDWPKQKTLYFHADEDVAYDLGDGLGLSDEALENLNYAGYEVAVLVQVYEDGSVFAEAIEGVLLKEPVRI